MTTTKLKVVSIGTTPMTRKINDLLERMECVELCGVVNLNPEKFSSRSNFEPLYEFRSRRPSDIFYTEDINSFKTVEWVKGRNPDVIIQSGWSQIWKKDILNIPNLYCLGIHAAPLPEGRGAAILNWKLIEGGGPWGNSLFIMEEKTDLGDIIDFEPFILEDRDDVRTAYLKADRTALTMIKRTLPKILDNSICRNSQKGKQGSRYYKRTPEDGLIDLNWHSTKICNHIRALTHPYPGAFISSVYGKIIIWSAEPALGNYGKKPGDLIKIEDGRGVLLQTGDGSALWLKAIEPENDTEVWADIWIKEIDSTNFTLH